MNMLMFQLAVFSVSIDISSAGLVESNPAVRPVSGPQLMASLLTTNNEHVLLELSPPGRVDSAIVARTDLGWVKTLAITKLDGYWLALSMPTNRFRAGDELAIKLVLINVSTRASDSIRVDRGSVTGALIGANWELFSTSGEAIESGTGVSEQESFGKVSGTSLLPGGNLVVERDIAKLFTNLKPGQYSVRLNGVLPSVIRASTQVDFKSDPLVFEMVK